MDLLLFKYLVDRLQIFVGVTLIWQEAVAASIHDSYRTGMALVKCGMMKIN